MFIDEAEFIEHFGKKGMKWGQRNSANRTANKASRSKDRTERKEKSAAFWDKQSKQVTRAQGQVNSGKLKKDWKSSKVQYKKDKEVMGSREARKIMNKKKVKINETYSKSQEVKTKKGQAAAVTALFAIGALQIASAAARAS